MWGSVSLSLWPGQTCAGGPDLAPAGLHQAGEGAPAPSGRNILLHPPLRDPRGDGHRGNPGTWIWTSNWNCTCKWTCTCATHVSQDVNRNTYPDDLWGSRTSASGPDLAPAALHQCRAERAAQGVGVLQGHLQGGNEVQQLRYKINETIFAVLLIF